MRLRLQDLIFPKDTIFCLKKG